MELEDFAKRVRQACVDAAVQAYEDAGVQGLCAEGRWEAAVAERISSLVSNDRSTFSSPLRSSGAVSFIQPRNHVLIGAA